MPPTEVDKLLKWAVIYPNFKEELLDPQKRPEALNKFQNPDEKDSMFGLYSKTEGGHLTLETIETLLKIEAENFEEFSKRCIEAGLAGGDERSQSPESGR